ncbi:SAG-related sequence [Besnoitia besnoiti]|uniref:SAG-related sequence n=1 Tax=Besnoitia besnoiti TaxID=94643 RepID=A0A2A9MFU9_BESBE|nr:SAG-related sequence [Besnoitia besnoiti]PFH36885.1 SAG-related sequence [Besnoitia besnoiti]
MWRRAPNPERQMSGCACLVRVRRSFRAPLASAVPSRVFDLFCLVFFVASTVVSYSPATVSGFRSATDVATCREGSGPLLLSIRHPAATVQFRCSEGTELLQLSFRKKPCGNTACSRSAGAALQSEVSKDEHKIVTLHTGLSLPKKPTTAYYFCGRNNPAPGAKLRPFQEAQKTCTVQVSVWGQNRETVPEGHTCAEGKIIATVIGASRKTTFQCGANQILNPVLFENVFTEKRKSGDTVEEKEVPLPALVESATLVENGTAGGADVAYTLSVTTLPLFPQTFFYRCVPKPSRKRALPTTGERNCKVSIFVEHADPASGPLLNIAETAVLRGGNVCFVFIVVVVTAAIERLR